ncbi:MAG: family 43 glycosylhydrolase, partial [Verrucomicrobiota bacterium]
MPNVPDVMSRSEIERGLESHDRALFIKNEWIRDPYLTLGPDDFYYLTGTTPLPDDDRQNTKPYNTGLAKGSIVGWKVQVWRSRDLIDWESLGTPYTLEDTVHFKRGEGRMVEEERSQWRVWAPEIHWIGSMNRWALVHCPRWYSSMAFSSGAEVMGPWTHPMPEFFKNKHDPSLFHDNGTWYLLWSNTSIAPRSDDFSSFTAKPVRIDPSTTRPNPM